MTSLGFGILGFLNYAPMTGYELTKAFGESVDFFWHAQNSQIYLELKSLEIKGYATGEIVAQSTRPNKRVYSITESGREEFLRWLAEPPGMETVQFKNTFLVKLFFGGNLSPAQSAANLKEFKGICESYLQGMETIPGSIQLYGNEVPSGQSCYWGLTADFGYSYIKMCIEWAERSIRKLEELGGESNG